MSRDSRSGRAAPGARRSFLRALGSALWGMGYAYRTESHVRFHLFALAGALSAARANPVEGWEFAYLLLTAAAVLAAELVNTAIERVVDLAAVGRVHPLARQAKDVAAGSVLLMALQAVLAGLWLFGWRRPLLGSVTATLSLYIHEPWWAFLVGGALVGWFWPILRRAGDKEEP